MEKLFPKCPTKYINLKAAHYSMIQDKYFREETEKLIIAFQNPGELFQEFTLQSFLASCFYGIPYLQYVPFEKSPF